MASERSRHVWPLAGALVTVALATAGCDAPPTRDPERLGRRDAREPRADGRHQLLSREAGAHDLLEVWAQWFGHPS